MALVLYCVNFYYIESVFRFQLLLYGVDITNCRCPGVVPIDDRMQKLYFYVPCVQTLQKCTVLRSAGQALGHAH